MASNGSGYTLVNNGNSLQTKSGVVLTPASSASAAGGSTSQVDPNGNTITFNGTSSFTDTTGSTALQIAGSNAISFTYPVTKQSNSATTASANLYYKQYTVRTNFGCSNIIDYGQQAVITIALVDHITLADGSLYSDTYEATPGATDGAVTGRVASITLPTTGTISYTRYGGSNGIVCADGSTPGLYRTTTDGKRIYQRAGVGTNAYTTMVQDEKGNQTLYHFSVDANGTTKPLISRSTKEL